MGQTRAPALEILDIRMQPFAGFGGHFHDGMHMHVPPIGVKGKGKFVPFELGGQGGPRRGNESVFVRAWLGAQNDMSHVPLLARTKISLSGLRLSEVRFVADQDRACPGLCLNPTALGQTREVASHPLDAMGKATFLEMHVGSEGLIEPTFECSKRFSIVIDPCALAPSPSALLAALTTTWSAVPPSICSARQAKRWPDNADFNAASTSAGFSSFSSVSLSSSHPWKAGARVIHRPIASSAMAPAHAACAVLALELQLAAVALIGHQRVHAGRAARITRKLHHSRL